MPFDIDWNKHRLVDLSMPVQLNQKVPGRPFEVQPGRLGDGTLKYDIVNTHTHVGSHVESPYHFYEKGRTCSDYPLDHFMGRAALMKGRPESPGEPVKLADVKGQLEALRGQFEILVVRNDSGERPLRFDMECVDYFASLGLSLFVFEANIEFGQGLEDGRAFHDALLGRDTLLVEFPAGLEQIDQDLFYLFAVPLKIEGIDSSSCRIFAILER